MSTRSEVVSLRWRWLATAVFALLLLGGGYILLNPVWPYANRWLGLATAVTLYQLAWLWHNLDQNRQTESGRLLPTFGLGNAISIGRGLLLGLLAGFLFSPRPAGSLAWLPALLYTVAALADLVDGYAARRTNTTTKLGARLDITLDGQGMLIVIGLAVWYGLLPGWYLLLGLARYAWLAAIRLRERWGWPVYELPPSVHRRTLAGLQMGFLTVILWPILPPAGTQIAGWLMGGPLLLSFTRDWLIVIGRVDPTDPTYRRVRARLYQLFGRWLPFLLRLALAPAVPLWLWLRYGTLVPPDWVTLFTAWGIPGAAMVAGGTAVLTLIATLCLTLGILTRLATWPLFWALTCDVLTQGLDPANALLLAGGLYLLQFGPGRWPLWAREEAFFLGRAGRVAVKTVVKTAA
jgi:CDP-diacylglycerol---glycerol-3-phosphate 3-phosphatidyltransferase